MYIYLGIYFLTDILLLLIFCLIRENDIFLSFPLTLSMVKTDSLKKEMYGLPL